MATSESVYQKYIGESFISEFDDERVATFDSEQDAKRYIKDSKLKQRQSRSFQSDKVFKDKSLLSGYIDAWVEEYVESVLPHNPRL